MLYTYACKEPTINAIYKNNIYITMIYTHNIFVKILFIALFSAPQPGRFSFFHAGMVVYRRRIAIPMNK